MGLLQNVYQNIYHLWCRKIARSDRMHICNKHLAYQGMRTCSGKKIGSMTFKHIELRQVEDQDLNIHWLLTVEYGLFYNYCFLLSHCIWRKILSSRKMSEENLNNKVNYLWIYFYTWGLTLKFFSIFVLLHMFHTLKYANFLQSCNLVYVAQYNIMNFIEFIHYRIYFSTYCNKVDRTFVYV